jgi:hypothetical protein
MLDHMPNKRRRGHTEATRKRADPVPLRVRNAHLKHVIALWGTDRFFRHVHSTTTDGAQGQYERNTLSGPGRPAGDKRGRPRGLISPYLRFFHLAPPFRAL